MGNSNKEDSKIEESQNDLEISKKESIKETISTFAYSILIALTFVTFINITFVSGKSMDPTLKDRDILLMEKGSVIFNNLEQGDVVSFKHKSNNKTVFFIKRIIGVPGNTVEITDGKVYVNGDLLDENYLPEGVETLLPEGDNLKVLLDEDEYFVLGDNRNNSLDSRFSEVGIVNKDQIISKQLIRLFNLPKF